MSRRSRTLEAVVLALAGWPLVTAAQSWPASRPRVEVTATSQLGSGPDFAPWRVVDGWASGLWCEGVAGPGLGQALTLRFDAPLPLKQVEVQGGALVSGAHFLANDVPIGWRLTTDAGAKLAGRDSALASGVPARGPSGITRFDLPGAPVRAVQLRVEGVLRAEGEANTCVSEVRLFRGADPEETALEPVPLPAAAYEALPGDLRALLQALASCDEAELGARTHFPLWWDVQGTEVKAAGGSLTPVTTLQFHNAAELASSCRKTPSEAPRPPAESSVTALLEGLYVEAPDRVAITFPPRPGTSEGMRWRLSFRSGRWVLADTQP